MLKIIKQQPDSEEEEEKKIDKLTLIAKIIGRDYALVIHAYPNKSATAEKEYNNLEYDFIDFPPLSFGNWTMHMFSRTEFKQIGEMVRIINNTQKDNAFEPLKFILSKFGEQENHIFFHILLFNAEGKDKELTQHLDIKQLAEIISVDFKKRTKV